MRIRALLVLLLAAAVAGVILLLRSRSPQIIVSTQTAARKPSESHPALSAPAPIRPLPASDTGTVELCGYGRMSADTADPGAVFRQIGALSKATAARWLAALQNKDQRIRLTMRTSVCCVNSPLGQ